MVSLEEPAKSQAKVQRDRQRAEFQRLNEEVNRQSLPFDETIAFIELISKDLLLLSDRLPSKPHWDVFREAIGRLNVRDHGCWTDPPANSALDTLEMRLREMLDLAGGTQAGHVPRSHASRRDRGPNLEISRRRVELEDNLRSELATVVFELQQPTDLRKLQKKFPDFQIWRQLSIPEQESLLYEPFKTTAYARRLVLRHFGLTSEETLKKDRKKLKTAANRHPVG
jgi:hypothetical protein